MITHNPLRGKIDHELDLGGFEPRNIELATTDGISISAWEFHDRPAPITMLIVHGWCSAKELMDGQIVFARRRGWDVVAIDLRNHGDSGGKVTSMGYHEVKDVEAAIDHVRKSPHLSRRIVIWGVSMGGVAALRAAARDGSIAGVIAESSYLSLRETVERHTRIFFGPLMAWTASLVLLVARWRARLNLDELDMEKLVATLSSVPVLFVAGEEDERTPPAHAKRLAELCASPRKRVFIAPHGKHSLLFRDSRDTYSQEVVRFVEDWAEPGNSSFGAVDELNRSGDRDSCTGVSEGI